MKASNGRMPPGIDFDLEVGGAIEGTIIDEVTGEPLSNIGVEVFDSNGAFRNYTSDFGNYHVGGLASGIYYLRTITYARYLNEPYR